MDRTSPQPPPAPLVPALAGLCRAVEASARRLGAHRIAQLAADGGAICDGVVDRAHELRAGVVAVADVAKPIVARVQRLRGSK